MMRSEPRGRAGRLACQFIVLWSDVTLLDPAGAVEDQQMGRMTHPTATLAIDRLLGGVLDAIPLRQAEDFALLGDDQFEDFVKGGGGLIAYGAVGALE